MPQSFPRGASRSTTGYGLAIGLAEKEGSLDPSPQVSVIVATRERPDSLRRCLLSLYALDYTCFEIIVVDNAPSQAGTVEWSRTFRPGDSATDRPEVRYVHEPVPGVSRARNRGIDEARGQIIAFVDDDVVVDPGWIIGVLRGFDSADGVAGVTGLVLPAELKSRAQRWFEEFGGFSRGYARKVYDLTGGDDHSPLYPFNAGAFGAGASMAFRAEDLRAMGGFDEALGPGTPSQGGEDLDCFLRVILSGRRLVYEPSAVSWHYHAREEEVLRRKLKAYGVGLAALMTKFLLNPATTRQVVKRFLPGVLFLLSPRSEKNSAKTASFPLSLTLLELSGILSGPLAYLRSVIRLRRSGGKQYVRAERASRRDMRPAGERF